MKIIIIIIIIIIVIIIIVSVNERIKIISFMNLWFYRQWFILLLIYCTKKTLDL